MRPDHRRVDPHRPLPALVAVTPRPQPVQDLLPRAITRPATMPRVHRLPVPVERRQIPPRRPRPGPPQHPVHHRPVIGPPPTPTRRPIRQQRLQTLPLSVGQIMTIKHGEDLPHPNIKILQTHPSRASPHPDYACRRWLLFSGRLAQGPAVSVADRHHPLRLDVLTRTRSAYVRVRCAVVALWCGRHPRYAHRIRPASTRLDSIMTVLPSKPSNAVPH